ncbi:MAG TPA: hypothetical protein VNH18_19710 [Bryobacteraceae bacterium]|nr:hypothetical protein [Bryobacteraceae bacterium]
MKPAPPPAEPNPDRLILNVLDSLKRARALLLDPAPQNIDCCRMIVAQCVHGMTELVNDTRPETRGHSITSVRLVRDELHSIAALLESAADFRRDILRVMTAAAPAPVIPMGTPGKKAPGVQLLG